MNRLKYVLATTYQHFRYCCCDVQHAVTTTTTTFPAMHWTRCHSATLVYQQTWRTARLVSLLQFHRTLVMFTETKTNRCLTGAASKHIYTLKATQEWFRWRAARSYRVLRTAPPSPSASKTVKKMLTTWLTALPEDWSTYYRLWDSMMSRC